MEEAKICHKHIYGHLPNIFESNLMPKLAVMIHTSATRSTTDINYHFDTLSKLNFANKSFTADCVRIWNDIPHAIKRQSSTKIFANDLCSHFTTNVN